VRRRLPFLLAVLWTSLVGCRQNVEPPLPSPGVQVGGRIAQEPEKLDQAEPGAQPRPQAAPTGDLLKCVGVQDGDTITVLRGGREERLRLNGIDCPEKAQPFGTRAKQFTSSQVFGKSVRVVSVDVDRYGRTVADVYTAEGQSVNRELVAAGLAWHYKQYSKDATLARLENEARAARRGLWSDLHSIPPWEWRHGGRASSNDSPPSSTGGDYIGNVKSRKFHLPSCASLPAPQNRTWFATREAALQAGYVPCKRCNP